MSNHVMVMVAGCETVPGTAPFGRCTYCGQVGEASLARKLCFARARLSPAPSPKGRTEYVAAAKDLLSVKARSELDEHGIGVFNLEMTAIWSAIADLQRGGIALLPVDAEDETLVDTLVARREKPLVK